MSSDFSSSDVEGSATLHTRTSPIIPSCWSDSDGRRRSGCDESPWWESEQDNEKETVCSVSPGTSPEHHDMVNISSTCTSSGTPSWWSEPSSKLQSTSCTEVDAEEIASNPRKKACGEKEAERNLDDENNGKLSTPLNSRKRQREPSLNEKPVSEPPVSKLKLETPSPHADPNSVLENLKSSVYQPLKEFLLFFNVDLLTRICYLTNTHGWEKILEDPAIASRDGSWDEITVKEMYALIAIILIMRRHQDVCFGAFWREPVDTCVHWPSMLMKRSRFFTILQMLRYSERAAGNTSIGNSDIHVPNLHPARTDIGEEAKFKEDRIEKEFECFFQQAKLVFKVFFRHLQVQCLEEILLRDGPKIPEHFRNYMKVALEYKDGVNSNQTHNLGQKNGLENSNERGAPSVAEDIFSNPEQDENRSDPPSKCSSTKPISQSKITNGTSHRQPHSSNLIVIKWLDNCLTVSANGYSDHQSRQPLSLTEKKEETGSWQDVFVPCPEMVYKGWPSDSGIVDRCTDEALAKSFFYHYLHLAVYLSTSTDVRCLQPGSGRMQSEADSLDAVVEGLVSLGKPDSVEQFGSDEELETDASSDSTATDESDSDVDGNGSHCDEGRHKPHRYVQARSRMGRKCALCWSRDQEVRRVHTRCTRCERHFCLSRFRNCMEEAHEDEEVMKQILDEETRDIMQDTSDVQVVASGP